VFVVLAGAAGSVRWTAMATRWRRPCRGRRPLPRPAAPETLPLSFSLIGRLIFHRSLVHLSSRHSKVGIRLEFLNLALRALLVASLVLVLVVLLEIGSMAWKLLEIGHMAWQLLDPAYAHFQY